MPDLAELTEEGTLTLPEEVAGRFRPLDRFLVWAEGDTVHCKRITPPKVTDIVAGGPEGEPPSPAEIAEEVREVRCGKRTR